MNYKNQNLLDALTCSKDGLKVLLKEKAAKRELILILFSIFYIVFMKPEKTFVVLLLILPLLTLSIEAINTSIEYLCDEVNSKISDKIKKAKDLGSLAILFTLIAYLIVFVMSFY